jgi:hypothetical protein
MADFRKGLLLAAMSLAFGATMVHAQVCNSTTQSPPFLRLEGQTELVGVINLVCTNVPAGTVNLDVTLNQGTVPITSRSGEPILQVSTTGQAVVGTVVALSSTSGLNDVRFTGVNIPAGATFTITISGIRGNMNSPLIPLGAGGFGTVDAVVSVSNGNLPIVEQAGGLLVGLVEPALAPATLFAKPTISQCAGTSTLPFGQQFTVAIAENFPTAFKVQFPNPAGTDSESGANPVVAAQDATSATQLEVALANVPTGVQFYLPVTINSTASGSGSSPTSGTVGTADLVTGAGSTTQIGGAVVVNSDGTTSACPNDGVTVCYVPATAGTKYYYNIVSTSPTTNETFYIQTFNNSATFSAGSFAPTMTVTLGPQVGDSGVTTSTVPRFGPLAGQGPLSFGFGTAGCVTNLLFPFLTNQAGFDTGVSIAATGTDPFSTNVAGGTCTMNLFGANAPTTAPSLTIPAGGENHTTISAIAPNFQGYGIAVCNFTYAHAYAFITDGFMGPGRGLSEGYVALIINDRGYSSGATVEQLTH